MIKNIIFGTKNHGLVSNGVLTRDDGSTMVWPQPANGNCRIVRVPGHVVSDLPADMLDYAIVSGDGQLYGQSLVSQPNEISWLYAADSGRVWQISQITTTGYMRYRRFGVMNGSTSAWKSLGTQGVLLYQARDFQGNPPAGKFLENEAGTDLTIVPGTPFWNPGGNGSGEVPLGPGDDGIWWILSVQQASTVINQNDGSSKVTNTAVYSRRKRTDETSEVLYSWHEEFLVSTSTGAVIGGVNRTMNGVATDWLPLKIVPYETGVFGLVGEKSGGPAGDHVMAVVSAQDLVVLDIPVSVSLWSSYHPIRKQLAVSQEGPICWV